MIYKIDWHSFDGSLHSFITENHSLAIRTYHTVMKKAASATFSSASFEITGSYQHPDTVVFDEDDYDCTMGVR